MAVVEDQIVIVDEWRGLYSESWKGVIIDEAFAHPAKFSRALIRKIYDHVIAEGWATKGDSVVDPFGGVALGGFDAMRHGLNWFGCELEQKFVELGGRNIALWNERYSLMPNWGTAQLLQGDSRKLAKVLGGAECCVSSPPYSSEALGHCKASHKSNDAGRVGLLTPDRKAKLSKADLAGRDYGSSEGQLGAMREGDHSLAVSSPPYNPPMSQDHNGSRGGQRGTTPSEKGAFVKYGNSDGQLEGMSMEGFECTVSSPPYESANTQTGLTQGKGAYAGTDLSQGLNRVKNDYAPFEGDNLGNQRGETFWSASRVILEQLHQVLAPNAHAVFVVKAFVRDKKIVDFPGQWAQLCEAVGFKLLHDHHALLTEHYGTQGGFEGDKKLSVERKSFFRRLAEQKGSPRIDHENVLCFKRLG